MAEAALPPELLIAEAAYEERLVERVAVTAGGGEIALGRHHPAQAWSPGFDRVSITTTVRHYRLRDVVLDAETMALFKDGRVIAQTRALIDDAAYQAARARHADGVSLLPGARCVIGCNIGHALYFYWMTHCLPAIDWCLRDVSRDSVRLILPPLAPWQRTTLDLLGYGDVPTVTATLGQLVRLPDVEYSQFLNDSLTFALSEARQATLQRLAAVVPATASGHDAIYISGASPYYGVLQNEAALCDLLARHGVHIVDPARLTLAERVNLFRGAKVVIGPHGEGLTDVAFCQPGALLWELIPVHYQNCCFNRLAQAARLDYWGDLFGADPAAEQSRPWQVDLDVIAERLAALSRRLAPQPPAVRTNAPPEAPQAPASLDELMLAFESLGDNCEFGLVQRQVGVEPLGLLRFAGMMAPVPQRCQRLITALEAGFVGLGDVQAIEVSVLGRGDRREYLVTEQRYGLAFHTFIAEGAMSAEEVRRRESRRLAFLRRKLLEDLQAPEKIWVWKSNDAVPRAQVAALLAALRRYGPNTLLWATQAATPELAGTAERLEDGLLCGHLPQFADYDNAVDIAVGSWIAVCQQALRLLRP